jgi:thiol-disulfide isomerase/thioredoxin
MGSAAPKTGAPHASQSMKLSRLATAGFLLLLAGFASGGGLGFSLKDAHGVEHSSVEFSKAKATVLMFVATDCPNSNTYAPVLARLYREYATRGVAFFNVYSDPSESAPSVRKHDADFLTPFAALLDPHQTLARQTGARSTPEAVILDPDGKVLYRGRVDNRFVAFGTTRYQPTENDLQEAIDAILRGQAVPHPVTRTVGCAIPGIE